MSEQTAMQLFDKGVISKQTLVENCSINWEIENKRMAEEKNLGIQNIPFNKKNYNSTEKLQIKIEQARRNTEVLVKFLYNCPDLEDSYKLGDLRLKTISSIGKNIDIMGEVKDI